MKRGLLSCWLRDAMESRYPRDTSVVANRERHHIARIEAFITHRASNPPMTMERSFRVTLETPDGLRSFDCGEDEHIWDAAASHQITLPATCHQGRCLTCAGRLLAGSVDHDDADAYFAQDEEEDYILLCRAMPRSDLHIRTHQEWEMREHRIASGLPAPYA